MPGSKCRPLQHDEVNSKLRRVFFSASAEPALTVPVLAMLIGEGEALLRKTDLKIQEIAATLGYSTLGGFARAFSRWGGRSPSEFRTVRRGEICGTREWREMDRRNGVEAVAFESLPDLAEET